DVGGLLAQRPECSGEGDDRPHVQRVRGVALRRARVRGAPAPGGDGAPADVDASAAPTTRRSASSAATSCPRRSHVHRPGAPLGQAALGLLLLLLELLL